MAGLDQENTARDAARPEAHSLFDRSMNERRILSLIRTAGAMPSVEIARLSGLSAQSASVITRTLEADGLIVKGTPQRGKVGKPLTPFRLNPAGALSVGLRIGRRSADMVLLDFGGTVRGHIRSDFAFPTPDGICQIAQSGLEQLLDGLPPDEARRIAGLGVAAPFQLWKWLDGTNTPKGAMAAWRDFDFATGFGAFTDLPILVGNDGSLACKGEHAFGHARAMTDFAYFYVGSFVGGGAVIGNRLYRGAKGNAAAVGSLPVRDANGAWGQLISAASVVQLEERLDVLFPGAAQAMLARPEWSGFDTLLDAWLAETSEAVAYAAITMVAAFDVPRVVIDCGVPEAVKTRLVAQISAIAARADTRGIEPPEIIAGKLGPMAGALGAGHQPIVARLLLE